MQYDKHVAHRGDLEGEAHSEIGADHTSLRLQRGRVIGGSGAYELA